MARFQRMEGEWRVLGLEDRISSEQAEALVLALRHSRESRDIALHWDWGVTYGLWSKGTFICVDDSMSTRLSAVLLGSLAEWVEDGYRAMELLATLRHRPGFDRPLLEDERSELENYFARWADLAVRLQAELGDGFTVAWEDIDGTQHQVPPEDTTQSESL
jgi:hypothetical protein